MATERSVSRSLCKSNWLRLQRENNSALFRWRRRHVEELESRRLLTVVANVGDADHQIWNLPATADQVEIRATSSNSFVIDSVNNTFDEVFFSFSGTSVTINAGDGADMLRFSNLLATNLDNRLTIVGGGGSDTLLGPVGDTDWSITGSGAGHVARVAFTGIENLTGAPDNQDTFVFDAGGSLSGVLDGGAGGFDVIKLSGGAFQNVAYTSSGLTSGSIARDGNIITYTDVEPIIDSTVGGTRTFDATAGADRISLRDRGTNLDDAFAVSIDTAEDVIFTDASAITSLVVNALGGDDKIDVDTLDSGFIGDLTINAGAGNDDITVLKISGPGQYTIAGDGDTNSFHFDAGGAITLTDAALNTLDLSNIQRAFVSGSTLNAAGFSGQVFFTSTQSLWTEQGPQPYTQILDGATVPWDPVAGAIQTIAVDPNDRFTMYVGTTNGGVWRNTGSVEVFFNLNDSSLDAGDETTLNAFADFLEAHPAIKVEIGGHTDSSGDAASNQTLSVSRATAVRDYLVNTRLIESGRLTVVGFGEDRPVAINDGSGQQPLNRRVELLVQNWEPVTERFPSLSIGSIAISSSNSQTIYAGTSRTSSFGRTGGQPDGLLFSNDGGDHWRVVSDPKLNGLLITKVLPTTLTPSIVGSEVVFVSTFDTDADKNGVLDDRGGVFRLEVGTDGTLAKIEKLSEGVGLVNGLPKGHYTDMAFDRGDGGGRPAAVYAATPKQGIFKFTEAAGVWAAVNTGVQRGDSDGVGGDDLFQSATRIRLAVHEASGVLYAGFIGSTNANGIFNLTGTQLGLIGLFKTTNGANSWTSMALPTSVDGAVTSGLHPGGQGDTHFSIAVDPTNANVVYVGGDAQPSNSVTGQSVQAGRIFRFNPATAQWVQVIGNNASNTAPHADSRGMVFVGDLTLLEIDDGGLYRLQNPRNDTDQGTRRWASLNRGMAFNEVLGAAFDTLNNSVQTGAQDNGSAIQTGTMDQVDNDADGLIDEPDERFFWKGTGGDGNSQAAISVDTNGDTVVDRSLRYLLHNNFSFLQVYEVNANGQFVNPAGQLAPNAPFTTIGFSSGPNAARLSGLSQQDQKLGFDRISMVVNSVNPTRMLVGMFGIYESINTNITPAAGQTRVLPLDQVRQLDPAVGVNVPAANKVHALVFGGVENNTPNAEVVIAARGKNVLFRSAATGANAAFTTSTIAEAATLLALTVDPDDWKVVYAADTTNVFRNSNITDPSSKWIKITGNLAQTGQAVLRSLQYVETSGVDVLLVGGAGGVSRLFDPATATDTAVWTRFGDNLPNAPVFTLQYIDRTNNGLSGDDVLLAGTLGRGAWTMTGDSLLNIGSESKLQVLGRSTADDHLAIAVNADNPLLFDITDLDDVGGNALLSERMAGYSQVQFLTRGGSDNLTVNHALGAVAIPAGISYDGGTGVGTDTLTLAGDPVPGSETGSLGGGVTFHKLEIRGQRELVLSQNLDAPVVNNVPAPLTAPFDVFASGLGSLVDVLTFQDGLSKKLPLFGTSLGRALNGLRADSGKPLGEKEGEEEEESEEATVPLSEQFEEASGDAVDLLRRFIETGNGAFRIDDIASFTTLAEIEAAFLGLDESGTGTVVASGSLATGFEITLSGITKELSGEADVDVDLDLPLGKIHLHGLVDIGADVTLSLILGLDNTHGLYLKSTGTSEIKIGNLAVEPDQEAVAEGEFGFLGVTVSDLELAVDPGVHFDIDLAESGGDGFIQLSELIADPASYASVTLVGNPGGPKDVSVTGTFEVGALVPGLEAPFELLDAEATIQWTDITAAQLNAAGNVSVAAAAGSSAGTALMRFLDIDTQDFVDRLTSLRDNLDTLYGSEVPFLSDGLSQLVDLTNAFQHNVLDPLTSGVGGSASIPSIQSLVATLAQRLGIDVEEMGLSYDSATTELTYHLVLNASLLAATKTLGAGVDLLDGLADLKFSSQASVDASLTLDTFVGVQLDTFIGGGDPLDSFFLRNPSASIEANITAMDVEAKARFGFLSIGVDEGTLNTTDPISLTVTLNDIGTNDPPGAPNGRIDFSELLAGVSQLDKLVSISGGGGLSMTLPVEAPFIGLPDIPDGGPFNADNAITVTIPDLTNPQSMTVVLGPGLTSIGLGNFRNIDAPSLVGVLGQLTFWLDQFRHSDQFADFDVPLVGPALDKVLGFADEFRDKVLIDDQDDGVDDTKTLLFDINAALAEAGIGDKLFAANVGDRDTKTLLGDLNAALAQAGLGGAMFAANVGGKIALVALDQSITTFTVNSAAPLGFSVPQSGSVPAGNLLAEAVATNAFGDAEGNLAADLSFTVTIGGKAYTVALAKATTDDNTKIGEDRIGLIALDPDITTFAVNGATALGFAASQNGTIGAGEHFAKASANSAFGDPEGNLAADLNFTVTIDSTTYTVKVKKTDTDANIHIGDDEWKLVNAQNEPTFSTAQELAVKLLDVFDVDSVQYHSADQTLTFSLDLSAVFGELNLPLGFSLNDNLPEFLKLQTNGQLKIKATGALNLEVGVFLGPAEPSDKLSSGKSLNELTDPVVISTDQRIVAANELRTVYGQLSGDAKFTLTISGDPAITAPIDVTVTQAAAANNATAANLVDDINAALAAKGLSGKIAAQADGLRIELVKAAGAVLTGFSLSIATTDPAVKDIGLPAAKAAAVDPNDSKLKIKSTKDLAALRGRLTNTASFDVSLNNVNGGSPFHIALTTAQTATNRYAFDIVNDIVGQFDPVADAAWFYDTTDPVTHLPTKSLRLDIGITDNHLTFTAKGGASTFTISNVAGTAAGELGLTNTAGNSYDLTITQRNGSTHNVTLDGAMTIGDVITKIQDQVPMLLVTINARGSGLDLTDTSPNTGGQFKVKIANNSTAGLQLGIVRDDAAPSEVADGKIQGADVAALTALDRFFIKATPEGQPALGALSVDISTPVPVSASAKFGFVGLDLAGTGALPGIDKNALEADLTLRLKEPVSSTDGRVSLAELVDSLDDIGSLFDLSLTGQGKLDLSLTSNMLPVLTDLGITTGVDPRIVVDVTMGNVFDGATPVITFTPTGFGDLASFGNVNLSWQSILQGLTALVGFLDDYESLGFLSTPLPVIDVSVKDLVSIANKFGTAVDQAQQDPAGSLQTLENKLLAAFGLPPGDPTLDLKLVKVNGIEILKVQINLGASFSKSLALNLDLGDSLPFDLGGSADLLAAGSVNLDLDFGFQVDDPTNIFIFDSTGVSATLNLAATDLTFQAAAGPFGVFVDNGSALLHGSLANGAPPNTAVLAGFQDAGHPFGMFELGDLSFDDLTVQVAAVVNVNLPVFFPTESTFAGKVKLDGSVTYNSGTGQLNASLVPSAVDKNDATIPLTSLFTFNPGNLSLLDKLVLGVDGIDTFLEGLQDLLDGDLGGFKLPLIGDKLSGAADVIGDFRNGFVEKFRQTLEELANPSAAFAAAGYATNAGGGAASLAAPAERDPISKMLFNLLKKNGGLGVINSIDDIEFITNVNQTGLDPKDVDFEWKINMGGTLVNVGAGIGFDLGIPGLGLETEGAIDLDIDWALDLGFGINLADGFYLDVGDNSELELNARVTMPGLGITGTLGFLQVNATENPDDPRNTSLTADFAIDILNRQNAADDKLGFAQLGSIGIDAKIAAQALADLRMRLSLSSDLVPNAATNFPSVVADFLLDWDLGDVGDPLDSSDDQYVSFGNLGGNFLKNGLQFVGFDHVGLDLGSYFSNMIGPIVEKVQEVTEPIKPFLDFLTEPIPVISDLAGPTSLLDIAAMSGLVNPGIIKAIEIVDQVIDIANEMEGVSGNLVLYFDQYLPGGLVLYDASAAQPLAAGSGLNLAGPLDLDKLKSIADGLPDEFAFLGDALDAVAPVLKEGLGKMLPGGAASGGFKLPIIEDPSQIFGMLMGQPADLVTFEMAPLELEAKFSAFFSILGPLGVSINAEFNAQFGPFKFGYDTFGITEFAGGGFKNPLQLFDGLYVSDVDAKGNDVPELQFDAGLWAAAELNLAIARGGVGGGLFANIDFDLHDPDKDGRVRIKEIVANILNEFKFGTPALSPLAMFDITGKLTAELFAFVKVDIPVFPIDEHINITDPVTLLDFESNFVRVPTLATEIGDGVLQLNMGKFASQRVEGDLTDGDETFIVKQKDADHVYVWSTLVDFDHDGYEESEAQVYEATKLILALGGEGKDTIDLSGVTSGVAYELEGNADDDKIWAGTTGTGAAKIQGGAGNDELHGGGGDDTIFGEAGDDKLWGGDGKDWMFGDGKAKDIILGDVITVQVKSNDGADELRGDDGDDLLIGGGGQDLLEGGANDDVLIGDGGQATVGSDRRVKTRLQLKAVPDAFDDVTRYDLAVDDTSKNGKGANDVLKGEGGNDHLYGGFGDDNLQGGDNDDVIFGELGIDTIDAGAGNDVVFGDSGAFVKVTVGINTTLEPQVGPGGEKDTIFGGAGNDKLLGGGGNDSIHGDANDDRIFGGTGFDELWGDAGNDTIFGDADSDKLYGGIGDDYLEGGGGNDLALGGTGIDTLVAGYGSDTLDGEADGDTYRISVRGGTTTELTTAYDTGTTGVDSLVVTGTPGDDTLLLRAMADSYFPTLPKLQGLVQKYFNSTLADRLAAMLQSFNDAYGPWDLPPGLVNALTAKYQENLPSALHAAVDDDANRTGDPDEPSKATIKGLIDDVLASNAASKIEAMQKAITTEYAKASNGAGVKVPNTLFSALTAAYRPALDYSNQAQVNAFVNGLNAAIAPFYVSESMYPREAGLTAIVDQVNSEYPAKLALQEIVDQVHAEYPTKLNLQAIVDQVYADTDVEATDRFEAIQNRVVVVYGEFAVQRASMLAALQTAWNALPGGATEAEQKTALKDAISDTYDDDAAETAGAKFEAIKSRIAFAYGVPFATQRDNMLDALQAAWDDLLAEPTPPTESEIKTSLKDAISDAFDDDVEAAAQAKFDAIKNRIEAAYVDRREVNSAFTDDEFAPQRTAMLAALQDAWDNLPDGATEAQQTAALKDAIDDTYTDDPVGNPTSILDDDFTNTAFVAVINDGGQDVERFNYRKMEGLVVNTLGGADYVVLDDLLAAATINLGDGNDRVQVGQVFRSERVKDPEGVLITGIRAEDVFTTVEITRGWLSNGVSVPTTINGGDGDDNFTVFRNVAVLNLNGGDGDDVFTVRAFALKGSSDNERARTDMKGDGGADTILYVVNAPVGIDGGDGFDTVRIVGTEFGDDFVVTDSGIFGAGLNVSYVNIERLVADGAEGDDRFFVQSTGLEVVTEIDGGLGSDTFFVGGNPSRAPVPVVSNDLRGHSGIILHSVSAGSDPAWAGLTVEGLSANVGDNEDAMILISESEGRTFVVEDAPDGTLGAKDSYRLRLSRAPLLGTLVAIAVVPAGLPPEEQAKNFADLEVWDPDYINPITHLIDPSWQPTRTVYLDASNWDTGVEIEIHAKHDVGYEGRRFTFVNHKVTEETTDVTFQEAQTRSLKVQMEDDERDGVIIVPSGLGNTVLEGGFNDTFDLVLTHQPKTPAGDDTTVTVTLSLAGAPGQILMSDSDETDQATITLTFNSANWNVPQTVTVSAVNDGTVEGFHTEYIRFDVSSADVDQTKGPFVDGQHVTVNGNDVVAVEDAVTGKVWLQIDADIDAENVQELTDAKPNTFVLLPHRPIAGTVVVRIGGSEELPPDRFSVTGNTLTFLSPGGAPEFRTGKVEVNYQYKEFGYDGIDVRDQVVDIYDNDTPTVIVRPTGDGMIDVVEGDPSATDTYTVRLASQPTQDVFVVIDSKKTRTTWGATTYFENQLLLSDDGDDGIDGNGDDETDQQQITLKFTPSNWDVEQIVTVRALDDDVLDGNDTQVFAPDLQTVNKIRGPLIIEGAAGAGSLTLPTPLMMPWELNIRPSDGNVVDFQAATSPADRETMTVTLADLQAVVAGFKENDPTFTLAKLVGKTLEMSKGPGTDVVLDPSRPNDKFARFWLITAVVEVTDEAPGDPQLVTLTLQNPTAVDPTQPNVTAPDSTSEYAITSLSVNFFADEREQIDYLFVYDNDSVADDTGALTSADGAVLAFDALTSTMTVETSALQRVADLLGLASLDQLVNRELTITVGPGTSHVFKITDVSDVEGETKDLTLSSVSGSGTPTNRSEFRIAGSDRYGRITGFGMGPNILFSGRPQGGGITYGDLEVVQVELGQGDDKVRVDYATNAEDHATKRTGDFRTQTILNTGGGDDEVTVALDNGDSTDTFDGSAGDGAFALDMGAGDDKLFGGASTRQLIVFGGEGKDNLVTGSGDDIVFGDVGRVDYTKKIEVDDVEYDAVVTRLGSSVPQNPVNPHVTFATDTTISDSAILGTPYEFPVDHEGLVGLSVQVISPEGHVQFRTIIANTADTITVDTPWDEFPVFDADDPTDNYFYRISSYPDDQTDGLFRGPRVIWSIKDSVGSDDHINSGGGADTVIGGAGTDTIHGDAGNDWIAGDNARFDFVPVTGNDVSTKLSEVQTTGVAFGDDDFLFGDANQDVLIGGTEDDTLDGGSQNDIVLGDQATIHLTDGKLVSVEDPGTAGDDTLTGGSGADLLIGGLGTDTIDGQADSDTLVGDAAKVEYGGDGLTLVRIETLERDHAQNGADTLYGGTEDDLLIGGSNGDNLDGGAGRDLIFGDNVLLQGIAGSGNAIDPRFRALSGTTIYGSNGLAQVAGDFNAAIQPVPGGRPSWSDWTITPDQTLLASHFGNDYIAGGAGNDEIFGQLGDDIIQGDGSILSKVDNNAATLPVSASRVGGLLVVVPSFENPSDGDDYIEGNGGSDLIFGNLGQDDMIGGSSNLFGLNTAAVRPDGSDLIFGGAGTDIARNDLGDTAASGHARDADTILGDNGNIYRLVGINGTNSGNYLTFNYDTYNTLKIIPRAAQLLDYTPGGPDLSAAAAAGDVGAADELHGESGDDFMYGMKGADALFGDGQDDNIVGGYGGDWISGGTGDDGILGDDGRLFASRNSTAFGEPVYGIAAILPADINKLVATQAGDVTAISNVSGQLKYTADLTPDNLDPNQASPNVLFRPLMANDIIYGGLGNDSIHAGAGDDAISGAEAPTVSYAVNYNQNGVQIGGPVASDFSHPVNPGNVLGYNPTTTLFALYDPNDTLRTVLLTAGGGLSKNGSGLEWLLNFNHSEGPIDTKWIVGQTTYAGVPTDGDDHIFADLGNDWTVGGTGRDTAYGGWGDDLINVDDVLTTAGGLNNVPETNPSWEDLAFGGAGRDVLISNTGGDRLVDWMGEFNTYRVPWSNYGEPQVIRKLTPALPEFLYALSKSQGADQTLAARYGSDPARNGEPFGELGLVLQKDAAWQAQNGGPRDPQAGNSKAKIDVNRSAGAQQLYETAAPSRPTATTAALLTDAQLAGLAAAARAHWSALLGSGDSRLAALQNVEIMVGNLPPDRLGLTSGSLILIDSDAAGRGWFVDTTPNDNTEFVRQSNGDTLLAAAGSEAAGKVDLLTVVMHELGHVLGLEHVAGEGADLMNETFGSGMRLLPTAFDLDQHGSAPRNGQLVASKTELAVSASEAISGAITQIITSANVAINLQQNGFRANSVDRVFEAVRSDEAPTDARPPRSKSAPAVADVGKSPAKALDKKGLDGVYEKYMEFDENDSSLDEELIGLLTRV